MNKQEAKTLGAWISLWVGSLFILSALGAIYVAFFIKPESATHFLLWLGRTLH